MPNEITTSLYFSQSAVSAAPSRSTGTTRTPAASIASVLASRNVQPSIIVTD